MANINLISSRRAERVRFTQIARLLMCCIALTLAAGLGTAVVKLVRIVLVRSQIGAAEKQLEVLEPIRQEIEANDRERMALQPKLVTLREARYATQRWFDALEGLKRAVPQDTWLTNLTVERQGETDQVMRVNGTTISQERVGETMLRLTQQSEHYQRVDLRFTQSSRGEYGDVVEFELMATLKPMAKDAPKGDANENPRQ